MSNLENSFSFLQKSVPQWLQDIARVEEKVASMQDEVTKVSVSRSQFGHRKSDSINSIHPWKPDVIIETAAPSNGAQTDPIGNRKRETISLKSNHVSGPSRYRPYTMVVVAYDGDVQTSFELLVRGIGTGRNMLRRAKMETKMNELSAGSSEDDDIDNEPEVDDSEGMMSKTSYRPRMSSMRARAAAKRRGPQLASGSSNTPVELLGTTDKTLEQAQELCEKAAHLTLRGGDCRKELEDVRKHFEDVLETARTEVVKCNARRSQEMPELVSHDTSDTSISSIESPFKVDSPKLAMPPADLGPQPKAVLSDGLMAPLPAPLKIFDIEIDDQAEDEDEEFIMPPIRLTSRLHARA